MIKNKIRWGIIGPGKIAREFAKDIQFTKHSELVAVGSRSHERAKSFAKDYNIPIVHDNYEALYNDSNVDAVYIATPHTFHLPNSVDAMHAGKAVLCEKPLTDNLKDTTKLVELARSSGSYLMEGMWTYFLPVIRKAQDWVADGRIGEVKHIKADFGYPLKYEPNKRSHDPELAGGCLLDMGCYTLAIAWLFLQTDPQNMNVIASKAPNGVDVDVSMQFEYEDATASLASSFRLKLHNWAFIIGEKGYIAIPDFWRAKECFLYEGENIIDRFTDPRPGFGFNFETDAVSLDLLRGKKESAIVPHDYSLKIARQIYEVMKRF